MPGRHGKPRASELEDIPRRMAEETSAFLTWALSGSHDMPRIPRRRVDEGGFGSMLKMPGARRLVYRWWLRVLGDNGD
ncbi:MAG: hypothetical protein JJU36_08260 [Phycisphaeraceae bacterium]|nr:hypothetical protein [Phycisphaeraceae bacterium]